MGRRCAFYEFPAKFDSFKSADDFNPTHYVQLRSAHNTSWYLGFNRRRRRISHTAEGHAFTLPKIMLESQSKRPRRFNPEKCDFLFATGEYSKTDLNDEWSGLFSHLEWIDPLANNAIEAKEQEAISVINHKKEKAAALNNNMEKNSQKESTLEAERLLEEVVDTVENNIENLKWKLKSYNKNVPEEKTRSSSSKLNNRRRKVQFRKSRDRKKKYQKRRRRRSVSNN